MAGRIIWQCEVCCSEFYTPILNHKQIAVCPKCGAKEDDSSVHILEVEVD